MKKLYSLLKATMTSDMNIFKIKTKSNSKMSKIGLLVFISLCFMIAIYGYASMFLEKVAPLHLQYIVLSILVFLISIMTIIEGVYKTSSLIFNCKDDQLLLSLPIKRRTVLFVRIFKFYVFELVFNSLFIIPLVIAYIVWADTVSWTFFLTSLVMIFLLPVIPIVISCIIGYITASLSSRFKYKNIVQIVITMIFLVLMIYMSYNLNGIIEYLVSNATSLNDIITKIYYPAGVYANLTINFNIWELLLFIVINIGIFVIMIFFLSNYYFKINSRLKKVTTSKKVSIEKITFKARNSTQSLIKKELNTFFQTPVFIINAGFALFLFLILAVVIVIKFDYFMGLISTEVWTSLSKDVIMNDLSLLILASIAMASFMTSITNSVISLEGKNINILKSLPIKTKTILMAKVYSSLIITTPVLLIGEIIMFIKFKTNIIEMILLMILAILMPLVSHFIGIIVNLKFPKLDAENATEVVKQSTSSFISVLIGMILLVVSMYIIFQIAGGINTTLVLLFAVIIFSIIDLVLYWYLINKSVRDFENLSV